MLANWIFGRIERRAYVLDRDTVIEIADLVRTRLPDPDVYFVVARGSMVATERVEDSAIAQLSAADRGRLLLQADKRATPQSSSQTLGSMSFRQDYRPDIWFEDEKLVEEIRRVLADSGRPRVNQFHTWRFLRRFLPFLALLAAWIWVLYAVTLDISVITLGWIAMAYLSATSVRAARSTMWPLDSRSVGHRIRNESRLETYARRADTHLNVKLVGLTALATIPVTLFIAWAAGLLSLDLG